MATDPQNLTGQYVSTSRAPRAGTHFDVSEAPTGGLAVTVRGETHYVSRADFLHDLEAGALTPAPQGRLLEVLDEIDLIERQLAEQWSDHAADRLSALEDRRADLYAHRAHA